jgi:hypothetical protein
MYTEVDPNHKNKGAGTAHSLGGGCAEVVHVVDLGADLGGR